MIHDFATMPRSAPAPVTRPRRRPQRRALVLVGLVAPLISVGVASMDVGRDQHAELTASVQPRIIEVATKTPVAVDASEIESQATALAQDQADWSFYERLPESTWPVPVQHGAYVDETLTERERPVYELQAASFRHYQDARRLDSTLQSRGLASRINSRTTANGEWHQVVVGPFKHNSQLNRAQDTLVALNLMPLRRRVN